MVRSPEQPANLKATTAFKSLHCAKHAKLSMCNRVRVVERMKSSFLEMCLLNLLS